MTTEQIIESSELSNDYKISLLEEKLMESENNEVVLVRLINQQRGETSTITRNIRLLKSIQSTSNFKQ